MCIRDRAKGERSSNGFIDRILFVMPNLQQKARWNDKELPENIEQEWNGIIGKLIQQEYALNEFGEIEPQILLFTEDAKRRLYEWQHHFSELCDRETNDTIVSIYCKLEIYIIRFCLIIQLARWTCGECDKTCIDLLTVERAIKLTEYFKESALNVQNILNENTLNNQQQTIVNLLPTSFTTAQAIQIAEQNGMKERTFQRFLNDNIGTLFRKEKHGEYSKINPCLLYTSRFQECHSQKERGNHGVLFQEARGYSQGHCCSRRASILYSSRSDGEIQSHP